MQVLSLHATSFTCKQQICGNWSSPVGQIRILVGTLVEQLYNYTTRKAIRPRKTREATNSQAATSVSNLRIANGCTESNPVS